MGGVVVVVEKGCDDPRRGRVHEPFPGAAALQGRRVVFDVLAQGFVVPGGDWPCAHRPLEGLGAREAGHHVAKLRVGGHVQVGLARAVAIEAGDSVLDVGGIADLAHLAVADDIDAAFHLPDDGVGRGPAHALVEGVRVHRLAVLPGQEQRSDVVWPGKASNVGGENAVSAELHGNPLVGWASGIRLIGQLSDFEICQGWTTDNSKSRSVRRRPPVARQTPTV